MNITGEFGIDFDIVYIIVLYNYLPEAYSNVAFRKSKDHRPKRMKEVDCPHCGRVFETVDYKTKIEIYRVSKKSVISCNTLRHCKICHGIVGIKYG